MTDQTNNAVEVSCDNQPGVIRICRDGENDHTLVIHNSVHVHYCDDGCGSASNNCNNGDGTDSPTDSGSDGTDNPTDGGTDPGTSTGDTNAADPDHAVGNAGGSGFGVGIYPDPDTLPTELTPMDGYDQLGHDNYGNYQHQDGSIMVFIPRFYYRIGSDQSPNWTAYGSNAMDIAGQNTFTDTAAANAANYVLHRAFIDGGEEKYGFFIDKYLCSKSADGTKAVSVKSGEILKTGPNTTGTILTQCKGKEPDAVHLARHRSEGVNVASVFMYSSLSMLVLAHAQASTGNTDCAWYDATGVANFVKGNNNSSKDIDDDTVTFPYTATTGDGTPFAKTTHNGQNSGITDLNNAYNEIMLGITVPGESEIAKERFPGTNSFDFRLWVLKPEIALGSLEGYWGGEFDAWGNERHLAMSYNEFLHPDRDLFYRPWGNGDNPVLSGAINGDGYTTDSIFMPYNAASVSAEGSNLMGKDEAHYRYNYQNMIALKAGTNGSTRSGVHARSTYLSNYTHAGSTFRCSLYAA